MGWAGTCYGSCKPDSSSGSSAHSQWAAAEASEAAASVSGDIADCVAEDLRAAEEMAGAEAVGRTG